MRYILLSLALCIYNSHHWDCCTIVPMHMQLIRKVSGPVDYLYVYTVGVYGEHGQVSWFMIKESTFQGVHFSNNTTVLSEIVLVYS